MKRDMDLIRELMLSLEAQDLRPGMVRYLSAREGSLTLDGYTPDQIDSHLDLISRSGFIVNGSSRPMRGIAFMGLEWAGHDFVDSVRDPEIWRATKSKIEKVKGFSFDLVVSVAKGLLKKKIADLSGVEIDL
eukprot:TRINITY_DN89674_c0_g1_i1.p1 TRINITY_DN89674_c0_g1~~TRINITY_DN89674_c0_g1_i1.p1  ORF type:complete len:132 (-),score=7.32 TRINITY_DN89674_c0_g1_i1:154-549(-)